MTWTEILAELRSAPTVSVPTAGSALAGLSRSGSYIAAREGKLPVPVIEVGGRKRVASIAVLHQLGLAEISPVLPPLRRRKRQPEAEQPQAAE